MTLTDLASLGNFVSGVAVLVSLIFLFFQLRQLGNQVRQAERNQQASIRHSRVSRIVEINLAHADPGIAPAWRHGAQSPDEITQEELGQFLSLTRALFSHLEDSYYQHKEGLLNEDAFEMVLAGTRALALLPGLRVAWKAVRRSHGGDFLSFMDGVVAGASLERPTYNPSVDEWRAAFAAEIVTGSS